MICRNLVIVTCLLHFGFLLDFYDDVLNIHFGNDILCTCSLHDGLFTSNTTYNNYSPSSCLIIKFEEKI